MDRIEGGSGYHRAQFFAGGRRLENEEPVGELAGALVRRCAVLLRGGVIDVAALRSADGWERTMR